MVPFREACSGSTFETRNTSSRRPAIALAIISSAVPYISAVSRCVMPRSSPRRSAAIAATRSPLSMCQVPWPVTATSRLVTPNRRCSICSPRGCLVTAIQLTSAPIVARHVAALLRADVLQSSHQFQFGRHTDETINLSAVFEHEQSRNALNVEARRRGGILVDIEFRHLQASRHLSRQFVHHRRNHPTWTAPSRPQVEHHRQRRAVDVSRKRRISHDHRLGGDRERGFALSAYSLKPLLCNLFRRHSIVRAAGCTTNQWRLRHRQRSNWK